LKGEAQTREWIREGWSSHRFYPTPRIISPVRLADLFLDTLPYNAHATASDALWAGVRFDMFGEHVSWTRRRERSQAIGMPELIAQNLDHTKRLPRELATNPQKMLSLRQNWQANRLTYPLFDTARFTTQIESAFLTMWQRGQQGLGPEHIHVSPTEEPQEELGDRPGFRQSHGSSSKGPSERSSVSLPRHINTESKQCRRVAICWGG